MKYITVRFGARTFSGQVPGHYTVGDLKRDEGIRMTLGSGDNVRVMRNGVVQNDYVQVNDNDQFVFETQCNEKGSR